jgi:hypothetical protein
VVPSIVLIDVVAAHDPFEPAIQRALVLLDLIAHGRLPAALSPALY